MTKSILAIVIIALFVFLILPIQPTKTDVNIEKPTSEIVDKIKKPTGKVVVNIEKPTSEIVDKKKLADKPKDPKFPSVKSGEGTSLTKAKKDVLKKARDAKRNDYILISEFIDREYIAKAVVKIAKLEEQIIALKKKQAETDTDQETAGQYNDEIARLTALIESEKLWEKYKDAYILYSKAYNNNEHKRATELSAIMKDVKKKYKTLTDKNFPPIIPFFYSKHKEELPELRKSLL